MPHKLFYLQGKLNVLADAFSRLPRFDSLESMEGARLSDYLDNLAYRAESRYWYASELATDVYVVSERTANG